MKTQSAQSSDKLTTAQPDDGKKIVEEHNTADHVEEVKMQQENIDDEEDPEEDPEEYEEMEEDPSPQPNPSSENNERKINVNAEPGNEMPEPDELLKGQPNVKATETKATSDSNTNGKREVKVDVDKKETLAVKDTVVDKELLQVFSFFQEGMILLLKLDPYLT